MNAAAIENIEKRVEVSNNHSKNIQYYGEGNDYPQSVIDIVAASATGSSCLRKYRDFVFGRGFSDERIYQISISQGDDTMDDLLHEIVVDYCEHGGFAIHVNRNLLGQITSMTHVPFANVRFGASDVDKYKSKIAVHPDWRGTDSRFKKVEVEYFDIFTPDVYEFRERVLQCEGGILQYKGEIYYYSNRGKGNYPIPIFDSVLADMSTQEAISNITYRNARKNFLPSCILAEINGNFDPNNEEDKKAFEAVNEQLAKMQGDTNTSSLLHIVVNNKDELPQAIQFKGENYDKEFTVSREYVERSIGQAFMQPKELRCDASTTGFSQDTMEQAYKVYNATTENDRLLIEREIAYLLKFWKDPIEANAQIQPITYGTETLLSTLGENVKDVVEIATNFDIPIEQRKGILMTIYGMEEDKVNAILLNNTGNDNND